MLPRTSYPKSFKAGDAGTPETGSLYWSSRDCHDKADRRSTKSIGQVVVAKRRKFALLGGVG